jgi:hypothetical protein
MIKFARLLVFALGFSFAVAAFEYPIAPERDFFSGAEWRERDQLVVPPEGLELKKDTILKIDELLLQGPLYTNGHSLKIDALQITFEAGGKIAGYKGPAPQGPTRKTGATGKRSTAEGGTGGNGVTPEKADPGVDGVQQPLAIVIFAARMTGNVIIDGSGQEGGKGGTGGQGGKGGTGGHGHNASASCWGWLIGDGNDATTGGPGGRGAPGGKGGKGGRGGAPIPLVIVSGKAIAENSTILSKPGEPGKPGDAGKPGERGDGGPGGLGDSKGCGTWPVEWSVSRDGAGPGPQGPEQTETLGEGELGDTAPPVDMGIAPMPVYKDLVVSTGIARADLNALEAKRAQLVDAWVQFHWSRTFLFLVLDTLTEIQRQDANRHTIQFGEFTSGEGETSSLLDGILSEADDERINALMEMWTANLVVPFQNQAAPKEQALIGAEEVAADVVKLLEAMVKEKASSAALVEKLERVRSAAYAQVRGTLDSAIDSCRIYLETKSAQLGILLDLTSQYGVPVCEGTPDFRLAENIDKQISLFHKTNIFVDDDLTGFHKRTAMLFNWSAAHAEGFVVVPGNNTDAPGEDVQKRIPDRGIWQVPSLGVFMGFPAIKRAASPGDIGQELFYLQQNLIRIRSR